MNPEPGSFLHLTGARVQFWQGSPDLVVDSADQVVDLSDPPWEKIDPADHWVEVDLTTLLGGGSRRGIRTSGTVVAIGNNSGIIERCPDCRRVLRDGACADHGPQRGEEDVRIRLVLDNGVSNASLLIGKDATESFTGMDQDQIKDAINANTQSGYLATLRERFLARKLTINGRAMVDGQGAILMADTVEVDTQTPEEAAKAVMNRWGVIL
jgi:replication factor A1